MKCVFYAIGSPYLFDVQESIERLGWTVEAYISNQADSEIPSGIAPVVDKSEIEDRWLSLPVVFPLITPGYRKQLFAETSALGFQHFASVLDPTAIIASRSSFDKGALVNSGVLVGARTRAGSFVVLNRGASVGHDVVVEDFVTLGPGAIICGGCALGRGAFIGAGAVINPELRVGANAIVGAGAVVRHNVPDHCLVVGNPAQVAKEGISGYNGVSV